MTNKYQSAFPRPAVTLLVFFLFSIYFGCLSFERLIAKDEGFYVLASKLVAQGRTPYFDFFYPQMPLLPYVYGLLIKLFGSSWHLMRGFTGVLAASMGTLVFVHAYHARSLSVAVFAALAFALCNFVFPWHLTVQTYALSTAFLFGSYVAVEWSRYRHAHIFAGLLFGLSVCSRLFFAGLFPLFLLLLIRNEDSWRKSFNATLWFSLGCLIGVSPCFYFMLVDFDTFFFNNLGYHLHRTALSPDQAWQNKMRILHVIFGFHNSVKFDAPHLPILLWVAIGGSCLIRICGLRVHNSLFIAAGLLVLNLLPTPSYVQYYCTLIPFLLCTCVVVASQLHMLSTQFRWIYWIVLIVLFGLYGNSSYRDIIRYTRTGEGVIGIRSEENAAYWNVQEVTKVSQFVDRSIPADKELMSIWPGYLFETHAKPLPGLENHFGPRIAPQLTKLERQRYHVITLKEVAGQIQSPEEHYVLDYDRATKRNLLT
ncbi:MAG: glycosyltransferase family 39 protein, partial [Bdellovibrionales bacterium]|nr:glycosyltransferase family 39 protein [Bdellovibrionales bacterium]